MKKGSSQIERVREHSRTLVYRCLLERSQERLSRNDISWATGLSNPTVSTVLQEFSLLSLVEEVGQSSVRGGRPAQLVRFNPLASCVISVDLSGPDMRALLVNLSGKVLDRAQGPEREGADHEALFDWLGNLHSRWSAAARLGRLAVAIPGVIEHATGTVHFAPALGWHNYPLAARLERQLGLSTTLENDVNALAFGEMSYGDAQGDGNALFLSITSGVGMGVVLGGKIFRGSHYAAGEIGYSRLGHTGRQEEPTFGQPGPLEAHLLALSRDFVTDGRLTLATSEARQAFEHFADDLAIIVQNAVCLLNPERLVVAWPLDGEHALLSALRESLRTPMPLEILPAALGADAASLGVAAAALIELEAGFCSLGATGTPVLQS